MKYTELEITVDIKSLNFAIDFLYGMGITDMIIDDPRDVDFIINKDENYRWDYLSDEITKCKDREPKLTLYFEDNDQSPMKIKNLKNELKTAVKSFNNKSTIIFKETLREDGEWKDKWKEFFVPVKISKSFVIKPSWCSYDKKEGEKVIEIDPGMAFGTGNHETTSLCVKMMEEVVKPGDKILDVGSGSGILSIVGAMLGASHVMAVDIDEVAVDVTRENVHRNRISNKVSVIKGDLTKGLDYKANVVVANLMADLVMELSKDIKKYIEDDGYFISSGILNEKVVEVVDCLRALDFKVLEVKEDGMWSSILCQK